MRLIIHHGNRITEHELGEDPVVIGRDPQCDLSFADLKLSRRHARIVPAPEGTGFQIVDLGSRNGCWINEERVDERRLRDGDELRLGSLHIEFEEPDLGAAAGSDVPGEPSSNEELSDPKEPDPSPEPEADATVCLSGREEETGTVRPEPLAPNPTADSTGTIAPASLDEGGAPTRPSAETRVHVESGLDVGAGAITNESQGVGADDDEEDDGGSLTMERPSGETVPFRSQPPRREFDTGTVLFRPEPSAKLDSLEAASDSPASVEPVPARAALSGVVRIALPVAAVAGLAILVLALPLAHIAGSAADRQTRLHGRLLAELLAASNARTAAEGRRGELSVARASAEPGIADAFLLDRSGRILAPSARAGQPLDIDGLDPSAVRTAKALATEGGRLVFVAPMTVDGEPVGVSVVRVAEDAWSGGMRPFVVVVLGALLLLVGAFGATLAASRSLLSPLDRLREDVEAVSGGRLERVGAVRPYRELEALATSLARWGDSAGIDDGARGASDSTARARELAEPTMVPGRAGKD